MKDNQLVKIAMLSAATRALEYKKRTKCSDDEAIAYVTKISDQILSELG